MQVRMQMHPADPRNFPMRRGKAERRRQQGSDREPVRKEEDAETVDTERRGARDQDGDDINPAAPHVGGRAFRARKNDRRDQQRGQACGEVYPAERQQVEVHNRVHRRRTLFSKVPYD
jgi:hypothetical protein